MRKFWLENESRKRTRQKVEVEKKIYENKKIR